MLILYRKYKFQIHWIKSHNNHPQNERCHNLAFLAAKKYNKQKIDLEYEKIYL